MKTHYEVLNLDKTCSSQEIKDSFIKLSKLYHPDKNKSSDAHKKFVEVNEAYSILGKPHTRCKYDASLMQRTVDGHRGPGQGFTGTTVRTPYEHYAYMYSKNRNQERAAGYITTSKLKTFFFCCLLMIVGSGLQLKAQLKRREKISHEIAVCLKEHKEKERLRKEERKRKLESAVLNESLNNADLGK